MKVPNGVTDTWIQASRNNNQSWSLMRVASRESSIAFSKGINEICNSWLGPERAQRNMVSQTQTVFMRGATKPLPIFTYGIQSEKTFGNATVYGVHDESQANNGEPNHRYGNSNVPLVGGYPNQRTWGIRCSETRDVSGISVGVDSLNSCADQLRYSVQGRISLVLTLRQLSREMQSMGVSRVSSCNQCTDYSSVWTRSSERNWHVNLRGLNNAMSPYQCVFGSRLIC